MWAHIGVSPRVAVHLNGTTSWNSCKEANDQATSAGRLEAASVPQHLIVLQAASRVAQDLSFAGGEDLLSEPAMETDEGAEELRLDSWQALPGKIVRRHIAPRLALFSPMSVDGMPCEFQDILPEGHFPEV